ncbi:MAG: hypothetical protein Q9163_002680 [Psora crenata]
MADLSEKEPDNGKGQHGVQEKVDMGPEVGGSYVLDVSKDNLKLHPQPTADSRDPLNWSTFKKHTILGIVMFKYAARRPPNGLQEVLISTELGITYSQVNWTVAIPALGLAVGPLFWSSLADIYGRRIIFVIGTIISFAATVGAAKPGNYGGYMAARFFQGFGVSPGATVGMAVVGDLFFEHQRGQKLGLWVLAIDSGLLVGPILGGFMDLVSSAWIQWFTAILFAALLVLELAFMPETLYPRNYMLARLPSSAPSDHSKTDIEKFSHASESNASDIDLPRTTSLLFLNFRPVPGMRHPKPWDSVWRFILTFKYPIVVIGTLTYCFTWYWWILSIITMLPAAYPTYKPQIQGLLFLGLLLGTLFSEVLCSGALSDSIVAKLAAKEHGLRVPEMRLWLAYPAALLSAIGLIVWGISVDKAYHWMVGQIAFFLFAAGIQMGNTIITSYVVDSYPLQSMSVITFYSVFLNLSAFIDPFFIAPWQAKSGFTLSFAAQGIITFFAAVPVIAALHKWGPAIRHKSGEMGWLNPEYDSL